MPFLVYLGLLLSAVLFRGRQEVTEGTSQMLGTCILTALAFIAGCFLISSRWTTEGRWKQEIRLNPYDAEAWHQLGYQDVPNSERIEAQQHAVELSPYNLYYREALASELELSNQPANEPFALQQYLQALILCPTRATDDLAVGRILFREGDPQVALEWFEKARRLEPYYWEADLWVARCYRAMKQPQKASFILKDLLERHARLTPSPSPQQTSSYEDAILGFDETVVNRALHTP
jgi:tetratricopeptide (TPR) repeat protein